MTDNFGSIPADLQPIAVKLLRDLRSLLDDKEFIQPVWFMIDRRRERIMPIIIPFECEEDKHLTAQFVRHLAKLQQGKVDAIIFACEAWRKVLERSDTEVDFRKTPVRDMPGREDIIMMMIETYDGLWIANPVVTGQPGEKRTLAPIHFEFQPGWTGELTNYLPPRNKKEIN